MRKKPPPTNDTTKPANPPGTGEGTKKTRKDGQPKAAKATAAEVSKRIDEVLRLKLDGAQFHDIVQYASDQQWGVVDRQLSEYMRRADELLKERQERKRSRLLAFHRAARRSIFGRAMQAADYRTALAVLDSEAKLAGLFPDGKATEVKIADVPLVSIRTDDEHPDATTH